MTGEGGEQQKGIESLINRDILRATFTNPKFLSHLVTMAHHANRNMSESGFSVQSVREVDPVISDLVKSPPMGSIEDRDASFSTHTNVLRDEDPFDELEKMEKTSESEEEYVESYKKRIKPGIFLDIHSHPFDKHRGWTPEDFLMPSGQDLDVWERIKLGTKNPYLIEGILIEKGNIGLLLLYQSDPNKPQANYYQAWGGRSRNELLQLMEDSGIRHETLTFDIKGKKFPEQELDKLTTFEI